MGPVQVGVPFTRQIVNGSTAMDTDATRRVTSWLPSLRNSSS